MDGRVGVAVEFFDALVRYEVFLWRAVEQELARRGQVGPATLDALRVVAAHDGRARVQDLSDDIGITVGAASKLADRLERDGLAVRRPNPENRRSSWLTLTPAGRRSVRSASRVVEDVVAAAVGEEDAAGLTEVLVRLRARLDRAGVLA